jgi:DNA-directed RNA polymerase
MVSWHPAFFDYIEHEDMRHAQMSLVRYMPMVTPPRPWSRFDQGGYLCSETFVMRGNYTRLGPSWGQIMALLGEQKRSDSDGECASYQPVLDALNVLGKTPWVVNERTVDVMQKVWDDGGGIAGVPPRRTVDEPVWPDPGYRLRRDDHALHATAQISREDKREYVNAKVRVKRENRELHSQRCDFLIKLKVAQEMRDEEKIFFPHNIDFRGRAYTMHAHLNHIGSDVCRGALLFQEARPLGENGLDWLYVQAANLYAAGGRREKKSRRRNLMTFRRRRRRIPRAHGDSNATPPHPRAILCAPTTRTARSGSRRRTRGSASRRSSRSPPPWTAATPRRTRADSPCIRCVLSHTGPHTTASAW